MYVTPVIVEAINVVPYDEEARPIEPIADRPVPHYHAVAAVCASFAGCCTDCNMRLCITCIATCLILVSIVTYAILTT